MLRLVPTNQLRLRARYLRHTLPSYQPNALSQQQYAFSSLKPPQPPNFDNEGVLQKIKKSVKGLTAASVSKAVKSGLDATLDVVVNPRQTWKLIKEVVYHYWVGFKLLWLEVKIAKDILSRVLGGHSMSRRERMQLIRTTTDIFRLVPFSIFIIVPFMELLLPVALKLFPNMLPSTFQDTLKEEETLKKELQMRLAVAKFMQETLHEMAEKKTSSSEDAGDVASRAKEVVEFVEKARLGQPIPNEVVVRIARLFKDELTLNNVMRPQLVSMCQYMGLQPYGADSFLRFQLRNKLRVLQEDDKRILWEGIDSLNTVELRDACRERGMRSLGVTHFKLKKQLSEWLELSTQKHIPISLLIMSRGFMLSSGTAATNDPEQVLKSSMSFMDSDIINEVVLNAASRGEADTTDMRKRRLESIEFQKEMIDEERLEQKEAIARKAAEEPTPATLLAEGGKKQADKLLAEGAQPAITAPAGNGAGAVPAEEVVGDRVQLAAAKDGTVVTPTPAAPAVTAAAAGPAPGTAEPSPAPAPVPAAAAAAPAPAKQEGKQEMTVDELLALSDLARGSSLKREISELAVLEAYLESLPQSQAVFHAEAAADKADAPAKVEDKTSAAVQGSAPEVVEAEHEAKPLAAEKEDRSVTRMKSAIGSMVSTLKMRIDTTEKALGDKLKLLDKDGDGEITAEEIKEVVIKVMKNGANTQDNAEKIFNLLDSNKDGKVSVVELLNYIQKKRERMEIEALEVKLEQDSAKDTDSSAAGDNAKAAKVAASAAPSSSSSNANINP
ncbi:LETM1-like protein-domain-containing protein [Ochromonadaceae sp. CCMP2298]|nr:LETM1-like protein-domain-containing protein [Ochromonadaceae sp. CCMP2298]|mmetsp:Transcript_22800/g.50709  ORF Transcript_22800/g.50709 Transcript_22800/m.50709 type:complete len:782 (+) Transcript_22800:206-2551(+)